MFFHVTHNCNRGDACRFSHGPISEAELENLRQISEEIEIDKKSVGENECCELKTMPGDLAKAILDDKSEVEPAKESFENIPSLSVQSVEEAPLIESAQSTEGDDLFF